MSKDSSDVSRALSRVISEHWRD